MLSKAEYAEFRGGQGASLALTAWLWAGVVLAVAVLRLLLELESSLAFWIAAPFVFVWIGWSQASLNNGFHEAVHDNLGAPHRERTALWLLGFPTFFTSNYRAVHMRHHQRVGDPEHDPDFRTYAGFPRSKWQFLGRLFVMGSGLAAARQLLTRNLRSSSAVLRKPQASGASRLEWVGLAVTQLVLLGAFTATFAGVGGGWMYVAFWLLPLGTVAKLAKSTRAFCEHGSPDHVYVLRTITGTFWQTATLGMYGFHYHGEHHLYPWVAYPRLPSLQARLASELEPDPMTRDGRYEHHAGGYFDLLAKWFRELPWFERQGSERAAS